MKYQLFMSLIKFVLRETENRIFRWEKEMYINKHFKF